MCHEISPRSGCTQTHGLVPAILTHAEHIAKWILITERPMRRLIGSLKCENCPFNSRLTPFPYVPLMILWGVFGPIWDALGLPLPALRTRCVTLEGPFGYLCALFWFLGGDAYPKPPGTHGGGVKNCVFGAAWLHASPSSQLWLL